MQRHSSHEQSEEQPLFPQPLVHHISFVTGKDDPTATGGTAYTSCDDDDNSSGGAEHEHPFPSSASRHCKRWSKWWRGRRTIVLSLLAVLFLLGIVHWTHATGHHSSIWLPHTRGYGIRSIWQAQEHWLEIDDEKDGPLALWLRTWGNPRGIPVLFVHGGPGNSIADYYNNEHVFFDQRTFFVVEVDQRGTGKSQPSVADDCRNMKYYHNLTIAQMSADYERVRSYLGISRWLVFGGSWGSTLSLDYAERYPQQVLGLVLRGIYLNTRPEFDAVFQRRTYLNHPHKLKEFDTWHELADLKIQNDNEQLPQGADKAPPLDPDDSERFFRIYGSMIRSCNRDAIWRHFVFESNLMEDDPTLRLDPRVIDPRNFSEAMTVAFFENRLFLHGTFDEPVDLLARVANLDEVPIWICQGLHDQVCPAPYAMQLTQALQEANIPFHAQFVDANHEEDSPNIRLCLLSSMASFLEGAL